MKKALFFVVVILMPIPILKAQESPPIKPLNIGDTVPDISFNNLVNYKSKTARLSDFENKVVILDFMTTTCSSCVKLLSKLNSLQSHFKDHLEVFVVTPQEPSKVNTILQKDRSLRLPFEIQDTLLQQYFPHKYVSHEVWIHKGIVQAITRSEYVTAPNIQAILNGESVNWPVKQDIIDQTTVIPGKTSQSSFFSSYANNLPSSYKSSIDTSTGMRKISITNMPIVEMYLKAYNRVTYPPSGYLQINIRDTGKILYRQGYKQEWLQQNTFCYEITFPTNTSPQKIQERMLNDLDYYLEIKIRLIKKEVDCWVLTKEGATDTDTLPVETPNLKAITLTALIARLNTLQLGTPALNETALPGKTYFYLPQQTLSSVESIKAALDPYGIVFKKALRVIEMLVITE